MARPAEIDPPELDGALWDGFSGELAFDIGANYGQSVPRILTSFQRVVAFEPSPVPFAALKEAWGSSPLVTVVNEAVSQYSGWMAAVELDDGQFAYPGTHGITGLTGDRLRMLEGVDLETACSRYGMPDFIKVDTEGHEVEILRGARTLMASCAPDWLIEFHSAEMLQECSNLLERYGARDRDRWSMDVVRHPHYVPFSENWHGHGWLRALQR